MLKSLARVSFLAALVAGQGTGQGTPNQIIPVTGSGTLLRQTDNGKLYVAKDGGFELKTMHLYGTPYEMGKAHGQLLGDQIIQFTEVGIPAYMRAVVKQIPFEGLPAWLVKLIEEVLEKDAPQIFEMALAYVWESESKFIEANHCHIDEEIQGLADGVCENRDNCNTAKLAQYLAMINMLPELMKMQCSMLGAWGPATPSGKLTQLRSLDFGGGPFANNSVVIVYHPNIGNPFVNIAFASFVTSVTGFSSKVGLSEKVWDVTGKSGQQEGHYDGPPVSLIIRDMLQFADTKEDAVALAQKVTRTWAVFLGVGDYASQEISILGYREKGLEVWSDETIHQATNQTYYKNVAYVDKHPQPSAHTVFPALVKEYYGKLDAKTVAQNIPRGEQSGDVHAAVYDFGKGALYVSTGQTDANGNYPKDGSGLACNRPFFELDTHALFQEKL